MPIYEYKCGKCGQVYEARQSFSDEPQKTHDGCGGEVERLISAPALQFKGSGWYITDYAKGSNTSSPAANGTKSETKAETKTDSKPAATPSSDKK